MVYHNDEWNFKKCTTTAIGENPGDSQMTSVRCECTVPGFIAVGFVIHDTIVENSVKEIFHYLQNVTFR